jgi:hypothetical protein
MRPDARGIAQKIPHPVLNGGFLTHSNMLRMPRAGGGGIFGGVKEIVF